MKIIKPLYCLLSALLFSILIALSLPACSAKTDDASIQKRINEELKKDRAGAALNATVDNGVVTITGECRGDNCAQDLAERVKKMDGVKDVQMNVIAKP
jgi:osmotically-inducible protein OsmY